jgi:hypothetical protein
LAATLLVLVQSALGMVVNLHVSVPRSHPGAHASNFFGGSFNSVVWEDTNSLLMAQLALAAAAVYAIVLFILAE